MAKAPFAENALMAFAHEKDKNFSAAINCYNIALNCLLYKSMLPVTDDQVKRIMAGRARCFSAMRLAGAA